jgi:Spy/CpxP family protein refolding chaperone
MALMMPPPQMFARMGDMLQLTEDQKTKLNTIFQKADTVRGPLAEKARNASEGLRAAALADQCDTGKLQEMAAQAERAEADLVKAEIDNWAQVRTVLTVDQVKKLREMMTPAPGMRPGAGPPPAGAPPRRAPGGGVAPGTRR